MKLNDMSDYYVYAHIDPKTDLPFYIGTGTGNRAFEGPEHHHVHYENYVTKYASEHKVVFLAENLDEDTARIIENHFINKYGRITSGPKNTLVNTTPRSLAESPAFGIHSEGVDIKKHLTEAGKFYMQKKKEEFSLIHSLSFLYDLISEQETIYRDNLIKLLAKKGRPIKPVILPFTFEEKISSYDFFSVEICPLEELINSLNKTINYNEIHLPPGHDNILEKVILHINTILTEKVRIQTDTHITSVKNPLIFLSSLEINGFVKLVQAVNRGYILSARHLGDSKQRVNKMKGQENIYIYDFEISFHKA